MRSIVENRLRMTLSDPPGAAATDDERRKTFVASMLVFEELLEAARSVDYIARPLPLFYALSQAGRAIVAARGDTPHVRGHGLMEGEISEPITGMTVKPRAKPGLFGEVARIVGFPSALTGPIAIGAAWSALPDLADTPLSGGGWPPALFVWPAALDETTLATVAYSMASLVVPDAARAAFDHDPPAFLAQYPHARHVRLNQPPGLPDGVIYQTPRGPGFSVFFAEAKNDGTIREYHSVMKEIPAHRFEDERWLIPHVGENKDMLPPLLLWWVLLFGLSLLARYESATWRSALDVERPLAVPLEDLMDEALDAVPHWVLWAVTGSPYLLPRVDGR